MPMPVESKVTTSTQQGTGSIILHVEVDETIDEVDGLYGKVKSARVEGAVMRIEFDRNAC